MHEFLKLLFIRHAQSIGNQEKRMQGHGSFELSVLGQQQAEKLARRLVAEGWHPTHVYSSPLKRAAQTTEILMQQLATAALPAAVSDLIDSDTLTDAAESSHPPLQVQYADELREFQNGIFQGLTWDEAVEQYPDFCQKLEGSPDWIPIPGAESLQAARDRAERFIQHVLHTHRNGHQLWVITHSWILQHLVAALLGSDRSWRLRASNTALFEFWIDQSRWTRLDQNRFNTDLWQIRRFNDCRHLYS